MVTAVVSAAASPSLAAAVPPVIFPFFSAILRCPIARSGALIPHDGGSGGGGGRRRGGVVGPIDAVELDRGLNLTRASPLLDAPQPVEANHHNDSVCYEQQHAKRIQDFDVEGELSLDGFARGTHAFSPFNLNVSPPSAPLPVVAGFFFPSFRF